MEMRFNSTLNDYAVRVSQLDLAIAAMMSRREPDVGIVTRSLEEERDYCIIQMQRLTDGFRRYGNKWTI